MHMGERKKKAISNCNWIFIWKLKENRIKGTWMQRQPECSGQFSRALVSDQKKWSEKEKRICLELLPYKFQHTTEKTAGNKKNKGQLPSLTGHFSSHWDTEPALTFYCFTMTVTNQQFHSFPGTSLPGNQIPLELRAETKKTFVFWVKASEQASSGDDKSHLFIQTMRRLLGPVLGEIWLF